MGKKKPTIEAVAEKKSFLRFPVVSLGAEYLVMGHLMRRNILAYKAPSYNEGYDNICIHPNPKKSGKQIRVQVKSRYQSDSDEGFPLKKESIDGFDFLIFVKLNIGFFFSKHKKGNSSVLGRQEVEFYTLTKDFCIENHKIEGKWQKVKTKGRNMDKFKNEKGFELIARKLGVDYPSKS